MKIYLVRHGQSGPNMQNVYNLKTSDINVVGIKQAEELKELIKDINYDVVISSPLIRAKHTAQIINDNRKEILFDDRLKERDGGDLEGKSQSLVDREDYWNYYSTTNYGNEERIPHLFERVASFIEELKDKEYENVLIVAHSGVYKAFYAYFNGIPKDGKFLNIIIKNCEIKEYEL